MMTHSSRCFKKRLEASVNFGLQNLTRHRRISDFQINLVCCSRCQKNTLEYLNIFRFLQIMLCTLPKTSPVERGYTFLEMIASKRKNHLSAENLETRFLLTALKILTKKGDAYQKEITLIERKL